MGVIQRQSLKYTIINFIGTFIGFLSVIFIYPIEQELYGYFQYWYSTSILIVPLLGLGINTVIVKYYPIFSSKGRHENFLSFSLFISAISSLVVTVILWFLFTFAEGTLSSLFDNFDFTREHSVSILLLAYLLLFGSIFYYQASARFRIVIPDMINNLALKIFLPILIIAIYLNYVDRSYFTSIILLYFLIVMMALFIYLRTLGKLKMAPRFDTLNRQEYKGFASFMGFSFLNTLGASMAFSIDNAMIGNMLSMNAVYIYGTIMVISNVIEIPKRALNNISAPVISTSWNNKNHDNIRMVYQKSSVYGWLAGLFLFLLLFFIWRDILDLMPEKMNISKSSVLIIFSLLGAARIMDLVMGVNSAILSYSEHYKYHMYFLIVMAISNVILNYLLISRYGIIGAAVATFISYVIFNLLKYFFIKSKFNFSIHWKPHYTIAGVGAIVFLVMTLLNLGFHPIFNIIIKASVCTILFSTLIYWSDPTKEIRNLVKTFKSKYGL